MSVDALRFRPCWTGKVPFTSCAEAEINADRMNRKPRNPVDPKRKLKSVPYRCDCCGQWHIGRKRTVAKSNSQMIETAERAAETNRALRDRMRESFRVSTIEIERMALRMAERGYGWRRIALTTGIDEKQARMLTGDVA